MAEDTDKKDLKKEIEKSVKMFDVAKPGATPASATSRPIIVRHASGMGRDPMVTEKALETPPTSDEEKSVASKSRTVVPLSKPESAEDAPADEALAENSDEASADVATSETAPSKQAHDSPTDSVSTGEENSAEAHDEPEEVVQTEEELSTERHETAKKAAVDSLVNEVSAKRDSQKQKEDYQAVVTEVEESVAKKEFFVPIGLESKRRSKYRIVFGIVLIIVLMLVLVNMGLDAEMIDIGIEPLTDLI